MGGVDLLLKELIVTSISIISNGKTIKFRDGYGKIHFSKVRKGKFGLLTFSHKGGTYYIKMDDTLNGYSFEPYRLCNDAIVLCDGNGVGSNSIISIEELGKSVSQFAPYR